MLVVLSRAIESRAQPDIAQVNGSSSLDKDVAAGDLASVTRCAGQTSCTESPIMLQRSSSPPLGLEPADDYQWPNGHSSQTDFGSTVINSYLVEASRCDLQGYSG